MVSGGKKQIEKPGLGYHLLLCDLKPSPCSWNFCVYRPILNSEGTMNTIGNGALGSLGPRGKQVISRKGGGEGRKRREKMRWGDVGESG